MEQRGENVLREEKRKPLVLRLFRQVCDPLLYVLMGAAAVSFFLGEYGDTAIIAAVIGVNAVVGVIQEGKAARALEALKQMASPRALVKVGEEIREMDAAELIPGDVVVLEAGCRVPADLKLLEAVGLKIEESALTGESVPVEKDRKRENRAYMSTTVTAGRGLGVVTAIGMNTRIGRIAGMLRTGSAPQTPLQKRLAELGTYLSLASLGLCALLFLLAVIQRRNLPEMFLTAISLAVAVVPEGLPAVVTMVLALSVSRMAKAGAIVRRLPSVETLGCVSVVCSDKTGTLTENKMTVVRCFTDGRCMEPEQLSRGENREFLQCIALCNDGELTKASRIGDPTELALLDLAAGFGLYRHELERRYPRCGEIAFDSGRKCMTTIHRRGEMFIGYTKGSPDEVLACCTGILRDGRRLPLREAERIRLKKELQAFTGDGLRVLALAMKENSDLKKMENSTNNGTVFVERELTFLGFAGMEDPLRPEAAPAVETFRNAGVRTVMITGDREDTAFALAKKLGIAGERRECLSGEALSLMDEEAFLRALPGIRVFAHVSPEHKVRIVKALKQSGETVAMTGDGVNDAPSLQAADVGVAMGRGGTDVARNAADLVLTDDNFSTIEKAIALGRGIYENIRKSVIFLLSSNFGEILTMMAAFLLILPSPLKPSHILWINLITDSLPALALGVDVNRKQRYMERPPRPESESLFAGGGGSCTIFYGILIALISLTAFLQIPIGQLLAAGQPLSTERIRVALSDPQLLTKSQTYAFTVLGMSQLFHAVGMRDTETSVFCMNHLANRLMLLSFGLGILMQLLVTEIPVFIGLFGTVHLEGREWGMLLTLSAMPLLAHELLLIGRKGTINGIEK